MTSSVRSRIYTAGGGVLAAAGLAATMTIGTAAIADEHTAGTTANAQVASTITLTGDDAFTLTGAPGDTATEDSGLTAESNSGSGYNVTVVADGTDLLPANTTANTDKIPVTSLQVADSAGTLTALGGEPVTVHTQDNRSVEDGDELTANYSLTMPFVEADTYSGGLTFTATAN